jgi:hypothetical protein
MKPINNQTSRLFTIQCKRMLIALSLLFTAKTGSFAQTTPYLMITSGTPCYGQTVNLAIVGATATSWYTQPVISGAITASGATSCTINCNTLGTFTLYCNYINGPGNSSGTINTGPVTINPTVVPTLTLTANINTTCLGGTVTYSATATNQGPYTYCEWDVDGKEVTTTSVMGVNKFSYNGFITAGTHAIECILTSSAVCAIPAQVTQTVNTTITSSFTGPPNVAICAGGSTTLKASGGSSYTWTPATGLSATTGASVVATPAATTTYTVTATGCSAPKTVTVTVNPISALTGSPCQPPTGTTGGTFSGTSIRVSTPVTITGSSFSATGVNSFNAVDVVGFVYTGSGTNPWKQVPIQVDEKMVISAVTIYNNPPNGYWDNYSKYFYPSDPSYSALNIAQYCDPNTLVGADTDPTYDLDDELSFMARDAGGTVAPSTAPYPANVVATPGAQITLTDPLNTSGAPSYIYVFKRANTSVLQSAGVSYVNYNFKLKSGTYANYDFNASVLPLGNPELSTVTTPYYQMGFGDRWWLNNLQITMGNSATANIIDRHRNNFDPSDCENEDNFDQSEGAYIANINGPIRGIKSFLGASSGPLTQRDHFFYDDAEVVKTYLRVHQIPAIIDYDNYQMAAGNMVYYNNNNGSTGININGVVDNITQGALQWELVTSNSGSVFRSFTPLTDFSLSLMNQVTYYVDDETPSQTIGNATYQCPEVNELTKTTTQYPVAWGTSGFMVDQRNFTNYQMLLPYTDPRNTFLYDSGSGLAATYPNAASAHPYFNTMELDNTNMFFAPGTPESEATTAYQSVTTPLTVGIAAWPSKVNALLIQTNDTDNPAISANVYPNPSHGQFTLEPIGKDGDPIQVNIYNSTGAQVYSTHGTGKLSQGVNLKTAFAGMGQYFFARITIGAKTFTKKIIIAKQ